MTMRVISARRKREACKAVWPILPGSEIPPAGWQGWPEGKQFAFTLSHDVEGPAGLAKVRQLAELEMSLGFRSSFNFVPEGSYVVPPELRTWLMENGFEVGVHDLHHEGWLYRSRQHFQTSAGKINQWLKDWNAVGFRSGFMLHNLDWQRDLEILYDASTFDTDPFEPQPDGAGTIFPFRVKGNDDRKGFVELPYTLAQDSTLFFVLKEKTNEIWKTKVRWLAEKGGMALLNLHPDYLAFNGAKPKADEFSAQHYADLLQFVSREYAGRYWPALPREVATFCSDKVSERNPHQPLRVCMLTYSAYEFDNRVRRYAESLAMRGDDVEVLSVSLGDESPRDTTLDGVKITHLIGKTQLRGSTAAYVLQVTRFALAAFAVISKRALKRKYDLIHVHNMPDAIVFSALIARLRGARLILDLHDLVPELFTDKRRGWTVKPLGLILRWEEKISAAFAQHVIVSNHLWMDTIEARSARKEKCSVFINNVDSRIFYPRKRTRTDDRRIILFHGSLSRHQGVDLVIRALPAVLARVPNAELHVYGSGSEKENLKTLLVELGLQNSVHLNPPVMLGEIPQIVANADVGVVAKRADSFGNLAYSTKILEFMSQGVPVVLSRTKIDQFYFDDTVARFFTSGDVPELADALIAVLTDVELSDRLKNNATKLVARSNWETRRPAYFRIVDALCIGAALLPIL
jgi:glycosyltransferase involved in cell wall biosynthesis/peptidoglycan/xylan/chitin deacetylase (PgdA/CDA1 family)